MCAAVPVTCILCYSFPDCEPQYLGKLQPTSVVSDIHLKDQGLFSVWSFKKGLEPAVKKALDLQYLTKQYPTVVCGAHCVE